MECRHSKAIGPCITLSDIFTDHLFPCHLLYHSSLSTSTSFHGDQGDLITPCGQKNLTPPYVVTLHLEFDGIVSVSHGPPDLGRPPTVSSRPPSQVLCCGRSSGLWEHGVQPGLVILTCGSMLVSGGAPISNLRYIHTLQFTIKVI